MSTESSNKPRSQHQLVKCFQHATSSLSSLALPELDALVEGSRDDKASIRTECDKVDALLVARHARDWLLFLLRLPQKQRVVLHDSCKRR